MITFKPTDEQVHARDLFSGGESLAIEAGAGTGKTSTLQVLAESTNRLGQYVAFNKAIVVESGEKMPHTVSCHTAHALAFRAVGRRYAARLNSGRMRSTEIAQRLKVNPVSVPVPDGNKLLPASFLAGLTMQAIVRFCQTADEKPSYRHVPIVDGIDFPREDGSQSWDNNRAVAKWVEPYMTRAWEDLVDIRGHLPYRHDHYLKLWQLSDPHIHADFILFDEAQDANPVMISIVAAQRHAQLVWVGDSQQQIYSWMGSINALASVPADKRAFLTKSFRFGPEIAEVANDVLHSLGAEISLEGTDTVESVVAPTPDAKAVLCRTNAAAVREVMNAKQNGVPVHLVGGGGDIISFTRAAQRLMAGQRVEHPELACFESWSEVCEYVSHDKQGGDLRLMVNLISEFTAPVIINTLDNMATESNARLTVSTAHKAKGREWASVRLAGDFPEERKSDEEMRLVYVGVTRARNALDITRVGVLDRLNEEEGAALADSPF